MAVSVINIQGLSRRGFRVNSNTRINYAKSAYVRIGDYPDARILAGHQGDYYSVPELDFILSFAGAVTEEDKRFIVAPLERSIADVTATVGTASSSGDVEVTIGRIEAGDGTGGTPVEDETVTIAEGETVGTADIDFRYGKGDIVVVEVTGEGTDAADLQVSFTLR